jgi:hypothetical protein
MKSLGVVGAALLGLGVLAPTALGHRVATKTQRTAILEAVVQQRQLSKAQANCESVTISTVNQEYAALAWPRKLSRACMKVAANGVIIEHDTSRGWQLVTVGSSFSCPLKGVPTPVARDLRICPS